MLVLGLISTLIPAFAQYCWATCAACWLMPGLWISDSDTPSGKPACFSSFLAFFGLYA